jgi:hypothetical protein
MAKRAKTAGKKDDGIKALAIAAMQRAINALQGSMSDKSVKLGEGAYPVELDVSIVGDITVGKAGEAGPDREAPLFGAREVLAGILASRKRHVDRLALVRTGMRHYAAADRPQKDMAEDADKVITEIAEAEGMTRTVGSPARAGAVGGKPSVRISGTSETREISVEVEAA